MPHAVRVGARCADWREAVRLAGRLLAEAGLAEPGYAEAMVRTTEQYGPYCVVAPGIALPHARPEDGARGTGVAVVVLAEPVTFGHATNDPVWLVIGLAARGQGEHLELLRTLAARLGDPATAERLRRAAAAEEVVAALQG